MSVLYVLWNTHDTFLIYILKFKIFQICVRLSAQFTTLRKAPQPQSTGQAGQCSVTWWRCLMKHEIVSREREDNSILFQCHVPVTNRRQSMSWLTNEHPSWTVTMWTRSGEIQTETHYCAGPTTKIHCGRLSKAGIPGSKRSVSVKHLSEQVII